LKPYILHITSWYPNDKDPQLGIFIKKHIDAVKAQGPYNHLILNVSAHPTTEKDSFNLGEGPLFSFPMRINKTLKKVDQVYGTPYAIHLHVAEKKALAALLTTRFFKKIPLIITEHWTGFRSGKFKELGFLYKYLIKRTYKKAVLVTTVSKALLADLQAAGIKIHKHQILGNVVDGKISNNIKISSPPWQIAFVADMVQANKNLFGFVKAIALLSKQFPVHVLAIGDGPDLEAMKKLVVEKKLGQKITFYGRQDNDFVLQTLEKVHCYVCSSFVETFSVATAEALFMGKPVIVTPSGGPEEFVTKICGIVCDNSSPKAIAKGIETVLGNYDIYNPKEMHQYIASKFGATAIATTLNKLYDNLK